VIAILLGIAAPALAEPPESEPAGLAPAGGIARLEASGYFGTEYFPSNTGLGDSKLPEQHPETSALFGARLTYLALPDLAQGHLQLGFEAELALATAWTGYGFDARRMSYFAPVFGWRANAILRLPGAGAFRPHLTLGGGGETIVSDSPYMSKETDPQLLWGVGASLAVSGSWQLRVDLRQGVMPARGSGATSTFEAQLGIGTTFGLASAAAPARAHVVANPPPDRDSDGDGIPDRLDACPNAAETVNGVADGDGCPEADPDGDGIVAPLDRCPNEPEDFDHFQDEDGCPDPDNDHDGIPDALDACPNEPETFNGFDDDDGCPDRVPPEVEAALATATAVRFEPGRARITPAARKSLERTVNVLRDRSGLKVRITVHTDGTGDKASELAHKRGEVLKGYLVEQGVADDQVLLGVGEPRQGSGPQIDIALAPPARPAP
jgi:OOP family OmpA-OmpF porin